jgi:hypothetical protein
MMKATLVVPGQPPKLPGNSEQERRLRLAYVRQRLSTAGFCLF